MILLQCIIYIRNQWKLKGLSLIPKGVLISVDSKTKWYSFVKNLIKHEPAINKFSDWRDSLNILAYQ